MTEDQIERAVERKTDALDAAFLRGSLTQAEYDLECKRIADWAELQYRQRRTP